MCSVTTYKRSEENLDLNDLRKIPVSHYTAFKIHQVSVYFRLFEHMF